jgi:hypothetical protein
MGPSNNLVPAIVAIAIVVLILWAYKFCFTPDKTPSNESQSSFVLLKPPCGAQERRHNQNTDCDVIENGHGIVRDD